MFSSSESGHQQLGALGDMEKGGRLAPECPLPCSSSLAHEKVGQETHADEYWLYAKHCTWLIMRI